MHAYGHVLFFIKLQVLFEMIDGSLHLHVGDFRWDTNTIVNMNPVLAALKATNNTTSNIDTTMQAQQCTQITRRYASTLTLCMLA
jgi:hypothetical protein